MARNDARVHTFPGDDVAFREHVEVARRRLGRWDAAQVLASVREAYPAATARPASSVGTLGGASDLWYVYRDGHARATQSVEASTAESDVATAWLDTAGRYIDVNPAAVKLFGRSRDEILGRMAGEFSRHEDDPELGPRLLAVGAGHDLRSTAILVRGDGTEVAIQFSLRSSPTGHRVDYRPLEVGAEGR
jgi:PAS domain S-box-containing protein